MRKTDRILVLERINPDKKDTGLFDPQVLAGTNQLHAVMDPNTIMWTLKYEKGLVPEPLKHRFTDFRSLKKHAEDYFANKNIKIVEVKD